MVWLEKFLIAFAMAILERAMAKAQQAAQEALARAELEKQRGETNEINVAKYNEAKTQEESLSSALHLLNRTRN